jgi:hypothetical protein
MGEILVWGSDYFYTSHHEFQAYYDIARSAFWQLLYIQLLNTNFVLSQYITSSLFFSTNIIKLLLELGDNPAEASMGIFILITIQISILTTNYNTFSQATTLFMVQHKYQNISA